MTGRRPRRAPPPPTEGQLLDWRDAAHWSRTPKPCRYCGAATNLRDSKRSPAHKVCAEEAIRTRTAEAADAYQNGTL